MRPSPAAAGALTGAAVALSTSTALACPACAQLLGDAYGIATLLMLGLPMVLFAGFGLWLRHVTRGEASRPAELPDEA